MAEATGPRSPGPIQMAGFFRDPITSHGISDALRDSESLACAILDNTAKAFEVYQRERDLISGQILDATDAIASFNWTLLDIEDRHRQFSTVMKDEIVQLSQCDMPGRLRSPVKAHGECRSTNLAPCAAQR